MPRVFDIALAAALVFAAAEPAAACSGETLEREFAEADLVVRARVVAETRVMDDEPSPAARRRWGDYFPIMLHRLRVIDRFKGAPGPEIHLFQEVTSGRFDVDWDTDYLLFLTYHQSPETRIEAARGATFVRYACGQSKPWIEVGEELRARLRGLATTG